MWEDDIEQPRNGHAIEEKVVYFTNPLQDTIPGFDFLPLRAGHTRTYPGYRKESARGDAHVMMFIVQGCGVLQAAKGTIPFSEGDVVGFFADEICRWWSSPHSPLEHYWIALTGEGGRGILSHLGSSKTAFVLHRPALPPEERRLLENLLVRLTNREAYSVWSIISCCFAIFDSVAKSDASQSHKAGKGHEDLANQTRRFIEKNFSQPLTIADLASLMGTSIEQLRRAFREAYGTTPYAYLTHIRLQRAQHLLRCGVPVKEVALSVGYRDPNYFSRLFRQRFDRPPSAFQNFQNGTVSRLGDWGQGDQRSPRRGEDYLISKEERLI